MIILNHRKICLLGEENGLHEQSLLQWEPELAVGRSITITVSALSSLIPARAAARLSVRETLAYEG